MAVVMQMQGCRGFFANAERALPNSSNLSR